MRKQRKEEEAKIIAQMEEALRENEQLKKESEPAQAEAYRKTDPRPHP